ncbi:hypothetical protein Cgig2_029762 [Carnegiea gigantea]|uniref:Uncharacterized protein n=1 Tax=Carnegiea gigantea TaxID=171969 RepID=A0A9Q1K496_9CARY|nr:hypothetical protein Cgig2_029762 [Carnegiea gigantea]
MKRHVFSPRGASQEAHLFKRNRCPSSPCAALYSLKRQDERVCLLTHQPPRSNRPCQPPPCNRHAQRACLFSQPSHSCKEICACWAGALLRGTFKRRVPWGRNHPARVVGQLAAQGMSSCLHTQLRWCLAEVAPRATQLVRLIQSHMDFDEGFIPYLSLSNPTQYAAYGSRSIPRVLDDVAHHRSSHHHRYWTSSHNSQVCTTIGTGRCYTMLGLIVPSTTIGAWCCRTTSMVILFMPQGQTFTRCSVEKSTMTMLHVTQSQPKAIPLNPVTTKGYVLCDPVMTHGQNQLHWQVGHMNDPGSDKTRSDANCHGVKFGQLFCPDSHRAAIKSTTQPSLLIAHLKRLNTIQVN